jgi:histidinol-phosphatase
LHIGFDEGFTIFTSEVPLNIYEKSLNFGLSLLPLSDQEILPRFRNCSVFYKPDGSELTEADKRAEEVIRANIEEEFPTHGIIGEEFGEKLNLSSTYRWIIDPIDGTTAFSLGLPTFGTLIALLEKDEPVMGIIHLPAMGETVYAAKGGGCWFKTTAGEAQRINVDQNCKTVSTAFVSSAGVHNSEIQNSKGYSPVHLSRIINGAKKFRFLGDCTQHNLVCRGKINVAIDALMQPWDSAAIVPCIREAGGVVSTISGDERNVVFGGSLVTSSSRELHSEMIEMLNSTK